MHSASSYPPPHLPATVNLKKEKRKKIERNEEVILLQIAFEVYDKKQQMDTV